ncbi:transposase [Streptomyces erythrochromogenes]
MAGLIERRRRSSMAARSAMRSVAVELGGRSGARLCAKLRFYGLRTSIQSKLTAPPVPARAPRILGIDEFAFRKGRTYGTVLVDVDSSRPVDVLPDRGTSTVAAWLQEHPGSEIICMRSQPQRHPGHVATMPDDTAAQPFVAALTELVQAPGGTTGFALRGVVARHAPS